MEGGGRSPAGQRQGAAGGLDYNAPLRSMRGGVAPSPFYKLSAELSKESLRVPGAVPFQWEQAPGRRKPTGSPLQSTAPHNGFAVAHLPRSTDLAALTPNKESAIGHNTPNKESAIRHNLPDKESAIACHSPKKGAGRTAHNLPNKDPNPGPPPKPSLAALFRQSSSPKTAPASPVPPPAGANSRRSASPRLPLPAMAATAAPVPPRAPPSAAITRGVTHSGGGGGDDGEDDDLDAASDAAFTDAFTATAGLSTFDDACSNMGASTPAAPAAAAQYGRDLIMHRFLPAAHTIACDSPQTPSRRFAIVSHAAAAAAAAAIPDPPCSDPCLLQPIVTIRRVPPTPLAAELIHEDILVPEQPPDDDLPHPSHSNSSASMKACGLFPFGLRHAFWELFFCLSPSRSKSQQPHFKLVKRQKKKTAASSESAAHQRRLADILREDDSDEKWSNTHASIMDGTISTLVHQGRSLPHPNEFINALIHDDAASSYYDASGRFSPTMLTPACYSNNLSYNVAKAGAMSPFPEGKGFLGLPKDYNQRASSINGNQGSTPIETQARISVSEYCSKLAAEMDGRYALIGSTRADSPRSDPRTGTADNSTQISPRRKQCSYANSADYQCSNGAPIPAEYGATDHQVVMANTGKGRASNGLHRNDHQCVSVPVPILKRPNSPSRFSRRQLEAASLMSSYSHSPTRQAYNHLAAHTQAIANYSSCDVLLSPPPLPKSPSESWLWKAMPLSASNAKPLSPLSIKPPLAKLVDSARPPEHTSDGIPQDGSKWESIVKGSHIQTGHLRFSEELFHHSQDNAIKVGST